MEHNPGLTDDQDVSLYIKRNLIKQKDPAIKIIRDEEVGRFAINICIKTIHKNIYSCGPFLTNRYQIGL